MTSVYMDGGRGRKAVTEMWTDAGWCQRKAFLVTPRGWVPSGVQLVAVTNQRDGTTKVAIEGLDDGEDSA